MNLDRPSTLRSVLTFPLGLAACLFFLGACGGSGSQSAGSDASAAAVTFSQKGSCDSLTTRARKQLSGETDQAKCQHVLDLGSKPPAFHISKTTVNGDAAVLLASAAGKNFTIRELNQNGHWVIDDVSSPTTGTPTTANTTATTTPPAATSPSSDTTAIKATISAWIDAARSGNSAVYCGIESVRYIEQQLGTHTTTPTVDCIKRVHKISGLPPGSGATFGNVRVSSDGQSATAAVKLGSSSGTVRLIRQDSRWVIDGIH